MWWLLALSWSFGADVELITSGAAGGVGAGRYRFELSGLRAAADRAGVEVGTPQAIHGVAVQGTVMMRAADGSVAALVGFLDGGTPTCTDPRPGLQEGVRTEVLAVDAASTPALFEAMAGRAYEIQWQTCDAGGHVVEIASPKAALPDLERTVELRLALTVPADGGDVLVVGRPDGEFTRRVSALRTLRQAYPDALFVDAGDFVDGNSTIDAGALSRHRPLGFRVLHDQSPAALTPGARELAAGLDRLLLDAGELPYVAANMRRAGQPALPASRVVTTGDRTVAIIGAVDPQIARWSPMLAVEGVVIEPPVPAVQAEVRRLRAGEVPVDVIAVLWSGSPAGLRQLQQDLYDVDLVIGDSGAAVDRVTRIDTAIGEPFAAEPRPAATIPLGGPAWVGLTFDDYGLSRVEIEPVAITPRLDPEPVALAAVTAVRLDGYPAFDHPLLPLPAGETSMPTASWNKIACEAALAASGADLAILPQLPTSSVVPGPLTELLTVGRLAVADHLEVIRVGGEVLPTLLIKASNNDAVSCGADLGTSKPRVEGRPVEPLRVYTVLTTDRVDTDPALSGLLAEGRKEFLLDAPAVQSLTNGRGAPMTLNGAVLSELRRLRDTGVDPTATLLARSPAERPPQWMVRLARGTLSATRFVGVGDPRYAAIPETLATSPSSVTIRADLDAALVYGDRFWDWDLRAQTSVSRLDTGVDDPQELADDLKLSTSATAIKATIPVGSLSLAPYTELMFDSEWTPLRDADGEPFPLQRDLSISAGLSTRLGVLKKLRVGALVMRDLSRPDKVTEIGGRSEVEVTVSLGNRMSWSSRLDAYVYGDTPDQDATDLRFKALADTRLALPLARWLSVSPYLQAFSFAGRVPETEQAAASWSTGLAVDVSGAVPLGR